MSEEFHSRRRPHFRVGGKTDPHRFVVRQQQHFFIVGFHDEERRDHDCGSGGRSTLSPVKEFFGEQQEASSTVSQWGKLGRRRRSLRFFALGFLLYYY